MVITVTDLQETIPLNHSQIRKQVKKILKKIRKKIRKISICFVAKEKIKKLNKKFFNSSHLTDVLSFDNSFSKQTSWEIVICTDAAIQNAEIFKTSVDFELKLYLVHGILHLSGFDDKTLKKRKIMQKREAEILKILN